MTVSKGTHREGLHFKKLDLHVHTPASKCFDDKKVMPGDIVKAAQLRGLAAIAITDHNTGEWIDLVKAAARGSKVQIIPGVEITCTGGPDGIHLTALFDPSCGRQDIESLLGNLGLKPNQYGDNATIVKNDAISVCRIISERGGLAILSHANSSKGVLHDMRGGQRSALIQCQWLSAAEATDFQDLKVKASHKRVVDLLDGNDATFKRKLAVYQASDNQTGTGDGKHGLAGIGSRCSFFKLDQINVDGLRQCFADPDVRIRQDYEFAVAVYPRICHVTIAGGFLDTAEATFHEGLNSILGAKGTGKSLLIEFLRFALNQAPISNSIKADHDAKLEARLENYGAVEVTLADETGRTFTVTRTYNPAEDNPYANGDNYDPSQLFPVLFLSQNEIIKIAESEDEQMAFIDRFFDFRSYQQQIDDLGNSLSELDVRLAEGLRAFRDSRQIEQSIVTAKREIEQLGASLKKPVFDQFAKLEIKNRALRGQQLYVDGLANQLTNTRKLYEDSNPPAIPAGLGQDPALKRAAAIGSKAKDAILGYVDEAIQSIATLRTKMEAERAKWTPLFQAAKTQYDEAVQQSGGDYKLLAQKRAKRVKDLESFEKRLTTFKQKRDQVEELTSERRGLLDGLKIAYEAYSKERQSKCKKIEEEAGGRLQVRIHEASNIDEFRNRLTALKRGSYLKDSEIDSICRKSDPGTFVWAVIGQGVFRDEKTLDELAKKVGMDTSRMRVLAEFLNETLPLEQLLGLEHKALPQDRPEIRYNVGRQTFEVLNRLSVGQKCTAMLIIALSEGTIPIVIDQPEDSLDIRSIWEDMCQKIRRGKERRQFIFTTHSSSLAVASDTDKFIILEADANQGKVLYSGSMDHSPISEEVMNYLEGGMDTYQTKFRKYRPKA